MPVPPGRGRGACRALLRWHALGPAQQEQAIEKKRNAVQEKFHPAVASSLSPDKRAYCPSAVMVAKFPMPYSTLFPRCTVKGTVCIVPPYSSRAVVIATLRVPDRTLLTPPYKTERLPSCRRRSNACDHPALAGNLLAQRASPRRRLCTDRRP